MSEPHRPTARTRTVTSPGPGSGGSGISRTSTRSRATSCTDCMISRFLHLASQRLRRRLRPRRTPRPSSNLHSFYNVASPFMRASYSLDDKYTLEEGIVYLSGIQALVRLPMDQIRRDRRAGLRTGAFISGYEGSPLGGYDLALQRAGHLLEEHQIHFVPGVNEDIAATAVMGSQIHQIFPRPRYDGVVGIWYGKGPGVDRSGDVFRHGNAAGSAKNGGVLCLAGDDHGAKSSTVPHQSDHAFISALMPYLYPSSIHEMIEMGLLGIAMSRYSGCWVGMKVITEVVETTAEIDLT